MASLPTVSDPPLRTVSASWNVTENATRGLDIPSLPEDFLLYMLQQLPDYRRSLDISRYGCMVLMVVGTVTNLLTVAVMTRRTMIVSTTCFYFTMLAVADLMVLYFNCLRRLLYVLNDHTDVFIQSTWSCRVWDFLSYFSYDFSSWILTVSTIDRFIAIRYPLKAVIFCTMRNASITVAAVVMLCLAKNMHFFFTFEMSQRSGCLPMEDYVDFMDLVWPWIDAVVYSFLPFSLLLFFNILIIAYHRKALQRKRMLHACSTLSRVGGTSSSQRLTTMLLTVSFTFMVMTMPRVILTSIRKKVFIFLPGGTIDFKTIANYSLVASIFNFLMFTNHSINFFLYGISGKKFRQEFVHMLVQCVRCKHRAQVFASSQPKSNILPKRRSSSTSSERRGSNSSVVSDDVAPVPTQPPSQTEAALSRVKQWAIVSFVDTPSQQQT